MARKRNPLKAYPALMSYIEDRSAAEAEPDKWAEQLRLDEQDAYKGGLKGVAAELGKVLDDYRKAQKRRGKEIYPYNKAVGVFLGLPIQVNGEPPVGYFMAVRVMRHYRLGKAEREIRSILRNDKVVLRIVAARSNATGYPVRFYSFHPNQIHLDGRDVVCNNGRIRVTLSSDRSIEVVYEKVAEALLGGYHYNYNPFTDGPLDGKGIRPDELTPTLF